MTEIVKLFASLAFLLFEARSFKELASRISEKILRQPRETLILFIPAGLYAIQNNLLFFAVSNLEAATFQVTYQLKIITTALLSYYLLGTVLSRVQYCSLVLLSVGVALVQFQPASELDSHPQNVALGVAAVLLCCFSSAFAGVFLEKQYKARSVPTSIRNIQLSICTLLCAAAVCAVENGSAIRAEGFFHGFTVVTILIILLNALGGMLIGVVLRYADNIRKGFATSLSIVMSSLLSVILFSFRPGYCFFLGVLAVLTATVLYNSFPISPKPEAINNEA